MNAAHYKQLLNSPENYRIKPEPKQVLMTVDDLPDGLIYLQHGDRVCIVTDFLNNGDLETEQQRGSIEAFHADGALWSTSRKGPWKPFTKTVEE